MDQTVVRRRSPAWVRQMPQRDLHGLAGRLLRECLDDSASDPQEWLYGAVISELEYRRRRARPAWSKCSCWFCIPGEWLVS